MLVTGIDKNTFKKIVIEENKKIICFGASEVASIFFLGTNIENRIEFFVDNFKAGQKFDSGYKIYDIKNPNVLPEYAKDNYLILVTAFNFYGIKLQLEEMGLADTFDIYFCRDIDNCETDLRKHYLETFVTKYVQMNNIKIDDSFVDKYEKIFNDESKIFLPSIIYMLTSKCSLRCKHCVQHVPYLKEHYEAKPEQVVTDIKLFLESIDHCSVLILMGGEPFVYKDLDYVLENILKFKNFSTIQLVTNGTIIPDKKLVKLLKAERILVMISDYGPLSKIAEISDLFKANNIKFEVQRFPWYEVDLTKMYQNNNLSIEEIKKLTISCEAAIRCKIMHEGKIYACPSAFNIHHFPPKELDYSKINNDFLQLEKFTFKETNREDVKNFFYKDIIYTCSCCATKGFTPKEVPLAEQL